MSVVYRGLVSSCDCGPTSVRTYCDESSRKACNSSREASFLHYAINDGDSDTSEQRRERSNSNVRNMVLGVAVSNLLKVKRAIIPNKPTSSSEHHLSQRRVNIKVVLPSNVMRREFSEMDFVEPAMKEDESKHFYTDVDAR